MWEARRWQTILKEQPILHLMKLKNSLASFSKNKSSPFLGKATTWAYSMKLEKPILGE
jgi:hypothetical protein